MSPKWDAIRWSSPEPPKRLLILGGLNINESSEIGVPDVNESNHALIVLESAR